MIIIQRRQQTNSNNFNHFKEENNYVHYLCNEHRFISIDREGLIVEFSG